MLLFLTIAMDEEQRDQLESLYIKYRKPMYFTAYEILKDPEEAKDTVQTAMIKLTKHLHKIKDVKSDETKAFILITTRNLAINAYNRKRESKQLPMALSEYIIDESTEKDPVMNYINLENLTEVTSKMNQKNSDYADLLTLKYYYDFSNSEIADLMKETENNVRVKLHRAKKTLALVIEEVSHEER